MKIERLVSGRWMTFCWPCRYGIIRRHREDVLEWAIQHQAMHQKVELQ